MKPWRSKCLKSCSSSRVSPPKRRRRAGHIEQQALRILGGCQTYDRAEGFALPGQLFPKRATWAVEIVLGSAAAARGDAFGATTAGKALVS